MKPWYNYDVLFWPVFAILVVVGFAIEFVREIGRIVRGEKRFW